MGLSAAETNAWSEEGLGEVWDDLQKEEFPIALDQAALWLRAAYSRGYVKALAEGQEEILTEALERNLILQVLVPVA